MPDPSPVLKVLHTGETDITSTDISKFTFHSGYPTLKVATSGSTTLTIPSGQDLSQIVVTHNLGYTPIYLCSITYSTKAYQVPGVVKPYPSIVVTTTSGPSALVFSTGCTDPNELIIQASTANFNNVTSDVTMTANWIIFLDEF
jgi:hypothetical protein